MIGNQEAFSILRRLNLNQYESKVYLALLAKGTSSAGEISELADVPRSRVYDVLVSLEKKGLATIQQSKPVKYVPIDPNEIVNRIKLQYEKDFQDKVENLKTMEERISKSLIPLYQSSSKNNEARTASAILRGTQNVQGKINQMINSASSTINKITPEQGLINFSNTHSESLKSANSKGIKTRVLTHVGDKNKSQVSDLGKHMEIRHLSETQSRFMITDDNESLIYLSSPDSQEEVGLWVKSPYLSNSLKQIFDHLWEKGTTV